MKLFAPARSTRPHLDAEVPLQLGAVTAAVIAAALTYYALFSYRLDYVGHMLAGFGGTLGVLSILLFGRSRRLGWSAVVVTIVAIQLGAVAEASVFRIAIFDPVDFVNQSLGACLAGAAVVGRRPSLRFGFGAGALGAAALVAGFILAFS
jgi:hypothetical protein